MVALLADFYGYEIAEKDLVITAEGLRGNGHIGRWELLGSSEEDFLFICPNNDTAVERVFSVYRSLVDDFDFDGVMLDKILMPVRTAIYKSNITGRKGKITTLMPQS